MSEMCKTIQKQPRKTDFICRNSKIVDFFLFAFLGDIFLDFVPKFPDYFYKILLRADARILFLVRARPESVAG